MRGMKYLVTFVCVFVFSNSGAQEYGSTDFEATGSPEAHSAFITGLLKMHNFEFDDARASFLEAQEIDPDFTMAYWGEALSHEQSFWHRHDMDKSRAALYKLGATAEERLVKAKTQREKEYLQSIEILFGDGAHEEREIAYSNALKQLHEKYPDDLDAKAFYALSILFTTYGGRDYARYMRAGAITEEILDVNPTHPGALHYNIHSYDDPIHGPLGLRAANVYYKVAPSAVHALHMGSHIYYSLGMWEQGKERNVAAFTEAVARQDDPNDPYGGEAYHSLTWIPYALQQQGENEEARMYIAKIAKQVEQYGDDSPVHRERYITTRASYLVDTQEWDSELAEVEIDHTGISNYAIITDSYVQSLTALNHGKIKQAQALLEKIQAILAPQNHSKMAGMEGMPGMIMTSGKRSDLAPKLLSLALEGQIEIANGNVPQGLALVAEAERLEAGLASEYGPAVPVQPMAELLGDMYLQTGDKVKARQYYDASLLRAVGRIRSVNGLSKVSN